MRILKALNIAFASGVLWQTSFCAGYEILRGDLFGRVTTRAEADSNIYANSLKTGDFFVTVVPEVGFKRDVALVVIDMSAGLSVRRFIEHSVNNDTNPFASASVGWAPAGGKTSGQVLASARQVAQANPFLNQRTVSDDYLLDGTLGHFPTEKFGYRVRSSYRDQDYNTPGLSGVRVFQAGSDARHRYSPKLESFLGYNFRESTSYHRRPGAAAIDNSDHQFLLGLDGELLPKVKGRVVSGTVTRRFTRTGRSKSALLLDSAVEWKWKQNISISLNARRDFDTLPDEQSILQSSFALAARLQASAKITLSGEGVYSRGNYSEGVLPRSDRTYRFNAGCIYSFTPRIQGEAFASFLKSDSTSVLASYDRIIAGLSVGIKL